MIALKRPFPWLAAALALSLAVGASPAVADGDGHDMLRPSASPAPQLLANAGFEHTRRGEVIHWSKVTGDPTATLSESRKIDHAEKRCCGCVEIILSRDSSVCLKQSHIGLDCR